MDRGDVLVEAQGLGRSFGSRRVVEAVSLALYAGEVTGFVGANGAGKTTTIQLMLGLLRGEGRTHYLGKPLYDWGAPGTVVGAVLGGVAGHPRHRLRAHLRMVATGSAASDRRVDDLLETVGLTDAANRKLSELSLGMAQRGGVAQALPGDPPVLILDEPASGLDPHSIRWLRDFLRAQAGQGRAGLQSPPASMTAHLSHCVRQEVRSPRGQDSHRHAVSPGTASASSPCPPSSPGARTCQRPAQTAPRTSTGSSCSAATRTRAPSPSSPSWRALRQEAN